MDTFQKLLSEHIAFSIAKQQALGKLLGEHTWGVDLNKGVVDFGEERIFPIQMLGTESHLSKTWLWAWANTESNIPPDILNSANKLKEIDLEIFKKSESPIEETTAHQLCMIASGVCNADAYYLGGYEGGTVAFLVYDTFLQKIPEMTPQERALVITSVLQSFETNHRLMVESFLKNLGCEMIETDTGVKGMFADGTSLSASFDSLGRITKIEV